MADTAAIVLQATAAATAAGMSVHPAVDTLTAAEDIRPEEGAGTPAAAGILVEATRGAAIARFFRSSFSNQVFHDLQLLECCRFDGVSELK